MTDLIVFGASDDLIETEGLISEEFNPPYNKPARLTVRVDGQAYARLFIQFDPDNTGEWRILPTTPSDFVRIVAARHEDDGKYDADGCPGYSDKALIDMQDIAADRVNVRVKAVK